MQLRIRRYDLHFGIKDYDGSSLADSLASGILFKCTAVVFFVCSSTGARQPCRLAVSEILVQQQHILLPLGIVRLWGTTCDYRRKPANIEPMHHLKPVSGYYIAPMISLRAYSGNDSQRMQHSSLPNSNRTPSA